MHLLVVLCPVHMCLPMRKSVVNKVNFGGLLLFDYRNVVNSVDCQCTAIHNQHMHTDKRLVSKLSLIIMQHFFYASKISTWAPHHFMSSYIAKCFEHWVTLLLTEHWVTLLLIEHWVTLVTKAHASPRNSTLFTRPFFPCERVGSGHKTMHPPLEIINMFTAMSLPLTS